METSGYPESPVRIVVPYAAGGGGDVVGRPLAEAGLPGYESDVWYALLAPHGTPRAIVDRLNREVSVALKSTEMRDHFRVDGITPLGSTPEQLAAYIKTENNKWSEVVKRSGAKNE